MIPSHIKKHIILFALTILLSGIPAHSVNRRTKNGTKAKTEQKASTRKSASKKTSSGKSTRRTSKKTNTKTETSAEAKRRQAETQKEIARTKEELRRNEAEVKKGLGELNRLNSDITAGRSLVAAAAEQVRQLDTRISSLESEITASEAKLKKMREDYLNSIRKIRGKRNSNSTLAFIFSSKNFSQAMRRMRYLKQISAWRSKKSAEISESVKELTLQKEKLEESKREKDIALSRQVAAQNRLNEQYRQQDALVGELRRNGQADRKSVV